MNEIVNTRLNFLVFMKATELKYALNTNVLLKVLSLFFRYRGLKLKWSGLFYSWSGAIFFKVGRRADFL